MSLVGGRGAVDVRLRSVTWEMYAWCIISQVAMCVWFLRGPDPVEDGLHFAGCEGFSAVLVAHLLQLVPQHVVAAINH